MYKRHCPTTLLVLFAALGTGLVHAESPADAADALVRGEDYQEIVGGEPLQTRDGRIEVAEFFNYACPACNAFEPQLEKWAAALPDDVHLVLVPVQFRPDFVPYAKAYYAAESLGIVEQSHAAVFRAIHETGALPGEGDKIDEPRIAQFYSQYGVSADVFLSRMNGFAVNSQMRKADQAMRRSQVRQTPTIVVNGRYRVKGKNWDEMFENLDKLIARERGAAAGS